MSKFIIVFLTMVVTLVLTNMILVKDNIQTNSKTDVIFNFDSKKMKCNCDLSNVDNELKENFANLTNKKFVPKKPDKNENIITSIDNIKLPKHYNITAEKYYRDRFTYPIEPIEVTSYEVYPFNQYKYLDIGSDTDKVIN